MPAAVVFILFVICLIIAIPVSIALTIASIIGKDIAPNHEPVTRLLKEKFWEDRTCRPF